MIRAIETYQRAFEGRPSPCRFFPSCSEYGHEAIRLHGAGRGAWLTTRRLLRCRPFGPSGFDPVPELPTAIVAAPDAPAPAAAAAVAPISPAPISPAPITEEC